MPCSSLSLGGYALRTTQHRSVTLLTTEGDGKGYNRAPISQRERKAENAKSRESGLSSGYLVLSL
jgi:hypothetical protein